MKKELLLTALVLVVMATAGLSAQPWVTASANAAISVQQIVRYLAYIAIVFGGVMYMFGGQGSHRIMAGIFIGGVIALGANSVVNWFPL